MIINDVMDTIKPRLVGLLDADYKVLMYSGMLDIIVALPLTEAFLQTVPWKGLDGLVFHHLEFIWSVKYVRILYNNCFIY